MAPLGLDDTSTRFSDQPEWRARLNPFYWFQEGRYELRHPASRPSWGFYPAAWGMFSTAMEYAQFVELWLNGGERAGTRLLSTAAVAEAVRLHATDFEGGYAYGWMRRPFLRTAPPAAATQFGGYGYGCFVVEGAGGAPTPAVIHHGGGDGTLAIGIPAQNAIVVWLTHSRAGPQLLMFWNRLSLLDVFGDASVRDESMIPADAAIAVHSEVPLDADRYVGTYVEESPAGEAPGTALRVFREGGRLYLRTGVGATDDYGALVWHLVPLGSDRFAVGSSEAVAIPQDAQVIDARGKYLIPGLWDMHTHLLWSTDASEHSAVKTSGHQ